MKRTIDLAGALVLLLLLSPLMALIAIAIWIQDRGSVLYRQERVGLGEKRFIMLKFRSMVMNADQYLDVNGRPTTDRVTSFGRHLRLTSLDELPQLVNVVRGEMSLVGPRPMPTSYLSKLDDRQRLRFELRPGITGLAQVQGRHALTWTERIEADLEYRKKRGLWLDLMILARTPWSAFSTRNANVDVDTSKMDLGD